MGEGQTCLLHPPSGSFGAGQCPPCSLHPIRISPLCFLHARVSQPSASTELHLHDEGRHLLMDLRDPMTRLQPRPRIFPWWMQDAGSRGWRFSTCLRRPVVVMNQCCGHCHEKADTMVRVSLSGFEITGDRHARSNQTLCEVCRADGLLRPFTGCPRLKS